MAETVLPAWMKCENVWIMWHGCQPMGGNNLSEYEGRCLPSRHPAHIPTQSTLHQGIALNEAPLSPNFTAHVLWQVTFYFFSPRSCPPSHPWLTLHQYIALRE